MKMILGTMSDILTDVIAEMFDLTLEIPLERVDIRSTRHNECHGRRLTNVA